MAETNVESEERTWTSPELFDAVSDTQATERTGYKPLRNVSSICKENCLRSKGLD